MATATTTSEPTSGGLREMLSRPWIATILVIAYIAATMLVLVSLNRADVWFPTYSTIAFPAFILSPFVILKAPLDNRVRAILIVALVLIAMPLIGMFDGAYLELAIQICIFTGLALGLNIVVGFAGLLDLGYIAFFAVGAYTWGMFSSAAPTIFTTNGWTVPANSIWPLINIPIGGQTFSIGLDAFWIFLIIGVVAAALVGILLGLPVLRLRGDYLAIVTLGFGEMIRVLARNLDQPINFTNGSQGLHDVHPTFLPTFVVNGTSSVANLFGIRIANLQPTSQQLLFYFTAIAIVAVIILIARRLDNSPIGRAWTAIREDEVAAIAMGVPLVKMKLLAFAMGASFAGAIGVLYGAKQTFVSPESFSLIQSISILAMVIVGGLGGIRGVILGAMIVTMLNLQMLKNISLQLNNLRQIDDAPLWIRNWPTQLEPAKYERFVFGILLIIMMIFRPAGILPEPRRRVEMRRGKTDTITDEEHEPIPPTVQSDAAAAGGK